VDHTAQTENSRHWIIEAFYFLLKTKSFQELRVKEIAEKAGVSRFTFYRHFENKEQILFSATNDSTADYLKKYQITEEINILSLFNTVFENSKNNFERIRLMMRDSLLYPTAMISGQSFCEAIFPSMNPLKTKVVNIGACTIMLEWLFSNGKIGKTEAIDLIMELVEGREKAMELRERSLLLGENR